jgi:hypothetical protein
MRIAIFATLLLVALVYAGWKGGGPERAMVGIAIVIVLWDRLLVAAGLVTYQSVDLGYLAQDIFGAAATILLALCAYRFWPLLAAVLHTLPLLAHFARAVEAAVNPVVYLTMQVAASWCVPPLLIAATWRHQQRLKRIGSYPSWRSWSRWSPPPTPSGSRRAS